LITFLLFFFLLTQNFIRHCTFKQGYSLLPLSAQCPFVNTATSLTCDTVHAVITKRTQNKTQRKQRKKKT